MPENPAIEFIYVLQGTGVAEAVTSDLTLYFQKVFIYPAKAVSAQGVITPNVAAISVGKSGKIAAANLTSLVAKGSIATATKAAHGFRPGMSLTHTGCTPAAFNVFGPIFNVTKDTYDFQMASAPGDGPAAVVGAAARTLFLPDVLNVNDLPLKYETPLGTRARLADIIVNGTTPDGVLIQAW